MKDGIEVRPNGLKIIQLDRGGNKTYEIGASHPEIWNHLKDARNIADEWLKFKVGVESIIDAQQCGATHYDTTWQMYLKVEDNTLFVYENGKWVVSTHKDGADVVNNGECINLEKALNN